MLETSNASGKKMMIASPNSTAGTPIIFTEEDGEALLSIIDKVSNYSGSSTNIINIVKDEVPAFFSG